MTVDIRVVVADPMKDRTEFRMLVLHGPEAESAQKIYRVISANVLNMRSSPDSSAPVVSRLARGSFVRVLRLEGEWCKALTPDGLEGWVAAQYVAGIE